MKTKSRLFLLTAFLGCLAFMGLMFSSVSCQNAGSADVTSKLMKLADLGLTYAVLQGKVKPGDVVAIRHGVAVLTTPGSAEEKFFSLAELGLQEAIARGKLKEGDALLIGQAQAILQPAPVPPPPPVVQAEAVK